MIMRLLVRIWLQLIAPISGVFLLENLLTSFASFQITPYTTKKIGFITSVVPSIRGPPENKIIYSIKNAPRGRFSLLAFYFTIVSTIVFVFSYSIIVLYMYYLYPIRLNQIL